jgi:hypothetical protein
VLASPELIGFGIHFYGPLAPYRKLLFEGTLLCKSLSGWTATVWWPELYLEPLAVVTCFGPTAYGPYLPVLLSFCFDVRSLPVVEFPACQKLNRNGATRQHATST